MNKKYLDDKTLQGVKNYVNSRLTKDVRATLLEIKLKTGIDCYDDSKELKERFWRYAENELKQDVQLAAELKKNLEKGNFREASQLVHTFIDKHYKKEWDVINKYNPQSIDNYLNGIIGILTLNKVDKIKVNELVEAININSLLDERYSKKNCDKELIKQSETVLSELTKILGGRNANELIYAFKVYFDKQFPDTYLNKQHFHNSINN